MGNDQGLVWMAVAAAMLPGFPLLFAKRWGQAAIFGGAGLLLAGYYGFTKDGNAGYAWFLVLFAGWIGAIIADQADAKEDREKQRHNEMLAELRGLSAQASGARKPDTPA